MPGEALLLGHGIRGSEWEPFPGPIPAFPQDAPIFQPGLPLAVPAASFARGNRALEPPPLNATIFGNTWRLGERIHVCN